MCPYASTLKGNQHCHIDSRLDNHPLFLFLDSVHVFKLCCMQFHEVRPILHALSKVQVCGKVVPTPLATQVPCMT